MKKKKSVAFAPVLEEHQKKPQVSRHNIIEDVVLLVNPTYMKFYDDLHFFLQDLGFYIIDRDLIKISAKDSRELIERRFKSTRRCEDIIEHFSTVDSAFYHVSKLNAYEEVDIIIKKYFTNWDDYFYMKEMEKPLQEADFASIFFPMDTPEMYETSLKLVCPEAIEYWGQEVVRDARVVRERIINRIIQTSVGDSIERDIKTSNLMIRLLHHNPKNTKSVHYACTTPKQGTFEVRIQNKYGKLNTKSKIQRKRVRLLDKFHSLSMYYTRL